MALGFSPWKLFGYGMYSVEGPEQLTVVVVAVRPGAAFVVPHDVLRARPLRCAVVVDGAEQAVDPKKDPQLARRCSLAQVWGTPSAIEDLARAAAPGAAVRVTLVTARRLDVAAAREHAETRVFVTTARGTSIVGTFDSARTSVETLARATAEAIERG
ncbi:MAG TPA: hypothetical protein VHB21_03185 [Minicystis sp.]|nr:hypothetical protein [Minicystis sp.]